MQPLTRPTSVRTHVPLQYKQYRHQFELIASSPILWTHIEELWTHPLSAQNTMSREFHEHKAAVSCTCMQVWYAFKQSHVCVFYQTAWGKVLQINVTEGVAHLKAECKMNYVWKRDRFQKFLLIQRVLHLFQLDHL